MASKKEIAISSVAELIAEVKKMPTGYYVYRGQADAKWLLKSGAARRIRPDTTFPEKKDMVSYIQELIHDAKSIGLEFCGDSGSDCCDLRILAELQHHGAATCMIDFTQNILIALWMACSEQSDSDGKIFAINLFNESFELLDVEKIAEIKIADLLYQEKVKIWMPEKFTSRIQSQSSVFAIAPDESRIPKYMVFEIESSKKSDILADLSDHFGINETQVYPDLPGFARANRAPNSLLTKTPNYYIMCALKLSAEDKCQEALILCDKVKKEDHMIFNIKGVIAKRAGELEKAKDAFDSAIKTAPKCPSAYYYNRGALKVKLGDDNGAMTDYAKAIELNPNNADYYNNRGNLKAKLDDEKGAMADYNKALNLDPQYAGAFWNKSLLLEKQERYNEAVSCMEEYCRLVPSIEKGLKRLEVLRKLAAGSDKNK